MGSTIGNVIKVTLFGESHGEGVGASIDGLKAGIPIDENYIKEVMNLRRAKDIYATARREEDEVVFLSGVFNGYTTGAPLTVFIKNNNKRSNDYPKMYRPSHADLVAELKYNGYQDYRGGGHFSARLTAPLVALGAIAMQILKAQGIEIGSHVLQIKDVYDDNVDFNNLEAFFKKVEFNDFPVLNENKKEKMFDVIKEAKENLDSVGGVIECVVRMKPLIGEPFFNSLESSLSHYLFSIPAVKGIEFGLGFDFANHFGSEVNDYMSNENGKINYLTNNNGGINGGISNGEPLCFKLCFKPTPSIMKPQQTINSNFENELLEIKGRHDPCVVRRAAVIVNSLTALCLLDMLSLANGNKWMG